MHDEGKPEIKTGNSGNYYFRMRRGRRSPRQQQKELPAPVWRGQLFFRYGKQQKPGYAGKFQIFTVSSPWG
jgi:hypothetical protein